MGGLCGSHNPISIKTILPVDRRECSLGSETVEWTIYVAWRSTRCLEMVEWAGYEAWRTIYGQDNSRYHYRVTGFELELGGGQLEYTESWDLGGC